MKKTKASLWVIVATVFTVLTLFMLPYTPKIAVNTTTVEKGTLYKTTLMEGILQYDQEQPIISLTTGTIAEVCVAQGDIVPTGTLLVRMDSTAEETALQTIIANQEEFAQIVEAMAVVSESTYEDFLLQQVASLEQDEQAIRMSIEAKQIRATSNCVIGNVYVSATDTVAVSTLLGTTHGETKVVTVHQIMTDTSQKEIGSLAILSTSDQKYSTIGELVAISAPNLDEGTNQYWQTLTYQPLDEDALSNVSIGNRHHR